MKKVQTKNKLKGFFGLFAAFAMAIGVGVSLAPKEVFKAEAAYTKLTDVSTITSAKRYVLGVDGDGFHYSGTSKWGLTSTSQAPYEYELAIVNASEKTFTAKTNISGTYQYLTIPTSNTFTMSATSTTLKLGSNTHSTDSGTIKNSTTDARHLRRNGASGLRSYAGTTGTVAFFYELPGQAQEFGVLDSISIKYPATKTTFIIGETFSSAGLTLTASDDSDPAVTKDIESGYSTDYDGITFDSSHLGTKLVTVTYGEGGVNKTTSYEIEVNDIPVSKTWSFINEQSGTKIASGSNTFDEVAFTMSATGSSVVGNWNSSYNGYQIGTSGSSPGTLTFEFNNPWSGTGKYAPYTQIDTVTFLGNTGVKGGSSISATIGGEAASVSPTTIARQTSGPGTTVTIKPAAGKTKEGKIIITISASGAAFYFKSLAVTAMVPGEAGTPVESISLSPKTLNLTAGGATGQISALVLPEDATNKVYTYESSDPAVATVSTTGVVTPKVKGVATITATTADGGFTDTATVNVDFAPLNSISLNKSTFDVEVGKTDTLLVTASPALSSNMVTWLSSNTSVATVVDGVVTGVAAGTATITATSVQDPTKTASATVTVLAAAQWTQFKTSSFDQSGSADYPVNSGWGAYFTSGYGNTAANVTGVVKGEKLLKDIPVGSRIRVDVAAMTNNASNTNVINIYGLNYAGERIDGISATNNTVSTSGSDGQQIAQYKAHAIANIRSNTLPLSLNEKVFGVEVEILSGTNRFILVQIDIYYEAGTPEVQADSFAALVNSDVGEGANGSCTAVLEVLENDYDLLSAEAKQIVDNSEDSKFVAARNRMAYLETWVAAQGGSGSGKISSPVHGDNSVTATIIIGVIGLTTLAGYYFLQKKKEA